MNKVTFVGFVAMALIGTAGSQAQESGHFPSPQKEHQWLQQLVGEWDTEGELIMGPDQPSVKCQGTETVRPIGDFWVISESKTTMMEMPMTGVLTLGYDPQKEKYVGTWIDSMTSYIWKYEGSVDEAGKTLTLLTEGPSPTSPDKVAKFREVLEVKDKDHKVFTSSMEGEDGHWHTFVTIHYHRKK